MTGSGPVRWFSELRVDDTAIAGGKRANLGELTHALHPRSERTPHDDRGRRFSPMAPPSMVEDLAPRGARTPGWRRSRSPNRRRRRRAGLAPESSRAPGTAGPLSGTFGPLARPGNRRRGWTVGTDWRAELREFEIHRQTGRIVLGYDGSECAGAALDWATAAEAQRLGRPPDGAERPRLRRAAAVCRSG
jgi:hypothetical protein